MSVSLVQTVRPNVYLKKIYICGGGNTTEKFQEVAGQWIVGELSAVDQYGESYILMK